MRDIFTFKYLKESKKPNEESGIKAEKILIFDKDDTYLTGLKLENMTSEDESALKALLTKFNEDLEPFVKKYFRKFLRKNIIGDISSEKFLK